jgi:hypothetical protein
VTARTVELWAPVPLPEFAAAYEQSTQGRVRSVARLIVDAEGRRRNWRGRVLSLQDDSGRGAPRCSLSCGGNKVTYYPRPAKVAGHNGIGEETE